MRNDLAELTSLNRDYINSVQNSDVKRFDEILAPDFYCSNPDKSLVDRAGFLKQTAIPVTIRNLEAHDVNIRLMGDFAIIHARTSYTTADGNAAKSALITIERIVPPYWGCGWHSTMPHRSGSATASSASSRQPSSVRTVVVRGDSTRRAYAAR